MTQHTDRNVIGRTSPSTSRLMLNSSLLTWQCDTLPPLTWPCDTYASLSQFEKTHDQCSCKISHYFRKQCLSVYIRLDSRSRASERRSSSSPSAVIRLVVVQGETLCWDSPPLWGEHEMRNEHGEPGREGKNVIFAVLFIHSCHNLF
jgi:hypothetical protein